MKVVLTSAAGARSGGMVGIPNLITPADHRRISLEHAGSGGTGANLCHRGEPDRHVRLTIMVNDPIEVVTSQQTTVLSVLSAQV